MNTKTKEILDDVKDRLMDAAEHRNIANSERLLSVGAGAFILYTGITCLFKSPLSALAEITAGGFLLLRGATGYCPVKDSVCPNDGVTLADRHMEG
ncbi:Protein of unknown function [Parapedobacter composti]|uniref:Inner membrane protein YgaP-like transmembrane domain-containing protein n=1 Tax=Parapedobacter composti TaxID=623281 RepID=A0A1I1LRJ7_9SPHI|nr:DUF2892 domain-containing protein [Parapedobacter composti]SFC75596.1 Protein of unknown function [Parapedobacter composti]